ncbi:hypothetical protein SOVF_202920, partial [Spinacia oleracea]
MTMKSLSRIGIGLSVVFTCLLLALVAEIYYLLWWKRRVINREIKDNPTRTEFFTICCLKESRKSSVFDASTRIGNDENNKQDYSVKPLEENGVLGVELMLTGPPRFLFPIKEETREDLESEDGKSREGKRSLSDLIKNDNNVVSPQYLTPISSPFLTPMGSTHSSQSGNGYNPFYEASSDAEFNKIVKLSPPPKFKFLRDAEEKLQKKLMLIQEAKMEANVNRIREEEDEDNGSNLISIIVDKNKENGSNSSSSE